MEREEVFNFSVACRNKTKNNDDLHVNRNWCCSMANCLSNSTSVCERPGRATSDQKAGKKVSQHHVEDPVTIKRKRPKKSKGVNVKHKIRKTFTMCCASSHDSSTDEDEDEFDNLEDEKIADGARKKHDGVGDNRLKTTKHGTDNAKKWKVNGPIFRPKSKNRENAKSSSQNDSSNQGKHRIRSKYLPSNNPSLAVALPITNGNSVRDNVSGANEVKRSKADHALDLSQNDDSTDSAVTTNVHNRTLKTARRRTKSAAKQENQSIISNTNPNTAEDIKEKVPELSPLSPLHFIDTDAEANVPKVEEAAPVYLETEATIDYGRCVVEPGHGERPDKKKLRKKEKVKTKGEANKHLKIERDNYANEYEAMMEEYLADSTYDFDDEKEAENAPEVQEESACADSPVVLSAVDQPQVLDDREYHLVPDEIKRADDPFLEDLEEAYKVATPGSNKKEKRKQKNDRKKEKRSRKGGQTLLKLA